MNNPIFSFLISFLIWFAVVISFSFFAVKNNIDLESEIAIDAEMIGDLVEEKIAASPTEASEEIDKISDLKKKTHQKKTMHHDHHYKDEEKIKSQTPKILHRPLPQIPSSLRKEAFKTKAIVRFYVDKEGHVQKFEFIKSASNPKLNFLLMKQLKHWKFEARAEDFTLDVNVGFEVR